MARKANHKKIVRTSVSLSESDYEDLVRISEKKKVSVAWVIRDAVEKYLNEEAPLLRLLKND